MNPLIIDPEFRDLIDPLAPAELDQLHRSLTGDGCIDPIRVWVQGGQNILLDGHNRYAYCIAHDIEFNIKEIPCSTRDGARNYIILNQLGRRNLDPKTAALLRGKLYYGKRREVGAPAGKPSNNSKVNCATVAQLTSTAEEVAKETGVSPRTIMNDAAYAAAAEAQILQELRDIRAGRIEVCVRCGDVCHYNYITGCEADGGQICDRCMTKEARQ